ncbi:MAG: hypothetical protein ACMUJM_16300 [bacterium]
MPQDRKSTTEDSVLLNLFHPSTGEEDHTEKKEQCSDDRTSDTSYPDAALTERVDFITHTEEISFENFLQSRSQKDGQEFLR